MKYCLIVVIVCCGGFFARGAHDPYFIPINKQNGLPSNAVYDIFQDSKGFIWITSDNGICCYDGVTFKQFTHPDQKSKAGSLIQEDDLGRIWYCNFDGYLYYVENGSIKALNQKHPGGYFNYGFLDNKLYFFQENAVEIRDLRTLKRTGCIRYPHPEALVSTIMTKHFYMLAGDYTQLITSRQQRKGFYADDQLKGFCFPGSLTTDGEHVYCVSKLNVLKTCYRFENNRYVPAFRLGFSTPIQSTSFADNAVWLCTQNGAYGYAPDGTPRNNGKPYFSESSISKVLKDREGNFWFTTTDKGIYFVPRLNTIFHPTPFQPHSMVVSQNGILFFDKQGRSYLHHASNGNFTVRNPHPQTSAVKRIFYDALNGNQFTSSFSSFEIRDSNNRIVSNIVLAVKDIQRVDDKYYAFAATGLCGFMTLRPDLKSPYDAGILSQLKPYYLQDNYYMVKLGFRTKACAIDQESKTVYFTTNDGLYRYQNGEVKELRLQGAKVFLKQLCNYGSCTYSNDDNGVLFEITGESVQLSTLNRFIPKDFQMQFIKRYGDYLYLTGRNDIIRVNLRTRTPERLNLELSHSEILDLAVWNNRLFLMLENGYIEQTLNPGHSTHIRPLFSFTGFTVNDKVYTSIHRQLFDYDQRDFEISYAMPVFNKEYKIPLYYRINGGKWKMTRPQSQVLSLASLAAGDYTIEFKPEGLNGNYPSVQFTILAPWWKTPVFLSLVLLFFLFLLYVVYRVQIRNIQRRNTFIAEKLRLETALKSSMLRSVKAQMNPHFFYNALNTIQSFIYEDDKRNASTYLSKFSKLSRMILEMSDTDKIALSTELQALRLYIELEEVRFNKDFTYALHVAPELHLEQIQIPSMLIQPYVENAVKHGLLHRKGAKKLSVSFELEATDVLKVVIDDNGVGRFKSAEINRLKFHNHRSFASDANMKRLNLLQKDGDKLGIEFIDKTDDQGESTGTTVIISIPF